MKVMEGDQHNKIAIRILKVIQNAKKQITVKWISARLSGNEKADILAKDGTRNGTPIDYSLKIKDAYRILEQTQREEWNNWYVLAPKIELKPWYRNTKLSSVDKRTNNHNAHIHNKLAGRNGGSNRRGV
jgi:hypothetical protein